MMWPATVITGHQKDLPDIPEEVLYAAEVDVPNADPAYSIVPNLDIQ
jgi:hypothetical protein